MYCRVGDMSYRMSGLLGRVFGPLLALRAVALVGMAVVLMAASAKIGEAAGRSGDHTMVMFVGEDLGLLSIASRREEGAWKAPAVATVLSREELRDKGIDTLSEALSLVPGFYVAEREGGSRPYLRGIPNSVLFLFDTVSLCSDLSKELHPLDHELSLAPVKRIEIVRGPSSVLWGPDAFGGVVNVVPLTGKDFQGVEVGVVGGGPDSDTGAYVNLGRDSHSWNGFVSISARKGEEDDRAAHVVEFFGDEHGPPVPPPQRYGSARPGRAKYLDTYACIGYRQALTLSAKASWYKRPYTMKGEDKALGWLEERRADWGYVKLEGRRKLGWMQGLRFTASYQWLEPELRIIDMAFHQKEHTAYGELVYDKSLWRGMGVLTAGISYRDRKVHNAPVWEAYLPDFLGPENTAFLPRIVKTSYRTRLGSLFLQYLHKKGDLDLVAGLRYDKHSPYQDHLSYNMGVVWSHGQSWVLKLFYGTAYRTPFSRQLLGEDSPELEKTTALSAQLSFRPTSSLFLGLSGFRNRIENHIMEDPYAGLSEPNSQRITGVELEAKVKVARYLELGANLTLLDNHGPDETYRLNLYSYVTPDGEVVKHFVDLAYPFDSGPDAIGNLWMRWKDPERVSLFVRVGFSSDYRLVPPRNQRPFKVDGGCIVDAALRFKDLPVSGAELTVAVKNLLNRDYDTAGTYSLRPARGISAQLWVRKSW